jgi:hypothetical protein
MKRLNEPYLTDGFLEHLARIYRSKVLRSTYMFMAVTLAGGGATLVLILFFRAIGQGSPLVYNDVIYVVFGLMAIVAAWFIRIFLCLSRMSHETLLRFGRRNGDAGESK